MLVDFYLAEPVGAGDILALEIFIPDDAERKHLAFLEQSEAAGIVAGGFELAEFRGRFEKRDEQGLEGATGADDPGGDAVDAGVEVVEADVSAGEEIAADQFLHDGLGRVVEKHDVIAIPADAAADVENDLRDVEHDRRDLVGEAFGGMEVAGVEAIEFLMLRGVAQVEFVGADDVGFGADAEEFRFNGVEVNLGIDLFLEDLVEGIAQAFARAVAIDADILGAIGNPDIGDGGRARADGPFRRR